ncbi:hypothetical protein UNDKW_1400 [Undibacterium sp. KW1]|nr:hypothetical protein UNDKW_1400 [Undibacterium sp. KW1]
MGRGSFRLISATAGRLAGRINASNIRLATSLLAGVIDFIAEIARVFGINSGAG